MAKAIIYHVLKKESKEPLTEKDYRTFYTQTFSSPDLIERKVSNILTYYQANTDYAKYVKYLRVMEKLTAFFTKANPSFYHINNLRTAVPKPQNLHPKSS